MWWRREKWWPSQHCIMVAITALSSTFFPTFPLLLTIGVMRLFGFTWHLPPAWVPFLRNLIPSRPGPRTSGAANGLSRHYLFTSLPFQGFQNNSIMSYPFFGCEVGVFGGLPRLFCGVDWLDSVVLISDDSDLFWKHTQVTWQT